MSEHTYTTELEFGGDTPTACFEVTVSFTYYSGCVAWGGTRFEGPINPPEDSRIEDITVIKIDGKSAPWFESKEMETMWEQAIVEKIEEDLGALFDVVNDI